MRLQTPPAIAFLQSACGLMLLGKQEYIGSTLHLCLRKQDSPQHVTLLKRKSEQRQTATTDRNLEPSLCSGSPWVYRNNPIEELQQRGLLAVEIDGRKNWPF